MLLLENIERREEKESGSVEIKLQRYLVIEFGLNNGMGDNFSCVTVSTNSKTFIPFHIQRNQRYSRRLYPQLARTGAVVLLHHPFGCNQKGNQGSGHIMLLLIGQSRSGVVVGVGVNIFRPESELESKSRKIRRLRIPAFDPGTLCSNFVALPKKSNQNFKTCFPTD